MIESIYDWLYSSLSLRTVGLVLGLILIFSHVWALLKAEGTIEFLKKAPRNKILGIALLIVGLIWALVLLNGMDLGEFWKMRKVGSLALIILSGLVITYVDEFLTARALGIIMLLAATPILNSAFLKEPASRIFIPLLAYGWIILGMCYVGMPYLMRDHVAWASSSMGRWKALCLGGVGYGVLLLVCAFAFWGKA
jgi:hypothetical protein